MPAYPANGEPDPVNQGEWAESLAFRQWKALADAADGTSLFRPQQWMPLPRLVLFNERGRPGTIVEIRQRQFRIGREQGDLVLPQDLLVSGQHALLHWEDKKLTLRDTGSRNGTFVRLPPRTPTDLAAGDHFLCGRRGFQFRQEEAPGSAGPMGRLDELAPGGGVVNRYPFSPTQVVTIGRARDCSILVDDPFVSPRHAAITFDAPRQGYQVADLGSLNGVYLRVRGTVELHDGMLFRLGDQIVGVLLPG